MKIVKIFSILITVLFTAVSCVFPNGGDNEGETSKIDCFVVGAWRIKSFCSMPTDADIYIEFRKSATFRILQHDNSIGFKELTGSFECSKCSNEESEESGEHILHGVYSSGESWMCDYRCSIDENGYLVMEGLNESAEVSVYEKTTMPKVTPTRSGEGASNENMRKPL